MSFFDFNSINSALSESSKQSNTNSGVDFSGKSLKLDTAEDAKPIVDAINACPHLHFLALRGNTLGVAAAQAIAKALEKHPELKEARWSDMFTGRMKTEIPPALIALGDGMIAAGARLSVLDLSDNAFGPIGVEGLAKLLQSEVCAELQELRLNNNGLGITGGKALAEALTSGRPPRLRVFIAGRNRLENDGANALAKVFQLMGSLEEIAMPQNGIYHVGIRALSNAFKQNPGLRSLNLNDNTIGRKGAAAIAEALPSLKNLKHINFGDCLLKCKGAQSLAQAFRDNQILLQSLDLSHNEIGRDTCLDITRSVNLDTTSKDAKVTLAGNSLGGNDNRRVIKEKFGDCVVLSDGEGSDEEFVTGSEEESSEADSGSDEEDSDTEDAQQERDSTNTSGLRLDESGVEEVVTDVAKFLENPSLSNFKSLGENAAEVIDTHLQVITDPTERDQACIDAIFKLSGLSQRDENAFKAAKRLYGIVLNRAKEHHAMQWNIANSMLVGLGLIKSEVKHHKITWELSGCYTVLKAVIHEAYFPRSLAETLRFFVQSKKDKLKATYNLDLDQLAI